MKWVFLEIKGNQNFISPSPPLPLPLPPIRPNTGFDLNTKISPSILTVIIILSAIFFISGLLHLLFRFLLSPSNRDRNDYYFDNVTALQGQLQQLFHLHDSGVDQSFIDTLPVFHYKSIIGLKNYPFDCAVCLCEFEPEDTLRLLPKCSHAFHVDCIDTWLLSHSTCPLCRSSLLPDFSSRHTSSSPYLLILESGSDHSSREIVTDRDGADSHSRSNPHLGFDESRDLGSTHLESGRKSFGIPRKSGVAQLSDGETADPGEKVVPFEVKLGKFRNVDVQLGEGSSNSISNSSNVDERRCFSMGSYEYIMDQESVLKVHVSAKKPSSKNHSLPGHRAAMSECGSDTTWMFKFSGRTESTRVAEEAVIAKDAMKRESLSISKIWIRGKKEKEKVPRGDCSLESPSGRGRNCDEENQKSENSESLETKTPSFARRTMLWLAGRQNNKVVHSSSASHV